jgi:hypothetical protein
MHEPKDIKRDAMTRRKIKVARLRNPDMGIREVIQKQLCNRTEENEDSTVVFENDGTQNAGDEEEGAEYNWEYCYEPSK